MPNDVALVTGGAGFIGSHVAREVMSLGLDVVVLDDLSGGFRDNVPAGAVFVEADINDTALVPQLFDKYRFRYVYHLAAYAAENLSHFIKRFNYTNNLLGTVNLLNASVNFGCECFVFTSSIAVYGSCSPPMREDTLPVPEDSYGIAKLAAEQELRASWQMFGLPFIVFRPHNVYGPGQNIGDRYRNVIGIFMNSIMQGRPMPIFGDGEQRRAFSYISDVAPHIAASPTCPKALNQIFNVGADEHYSVNDLSEMVAKVMGVSRQVQHLPARREVKYAWSTHEKFESVFSCSARTTLEEGLRQMAEWALAVGCRTSQPYTNIEIEKNLPEVWKIPSQEAAFTHS